ncbi:MAG: hypothetical protein KBH07_05800 [Flavobacteriales bacterium]|nr:hypothetical protein [Flavobacteriales bacterium]MBP9081155.1 hypothetical protein [Flavobacteriales bacterium]
MLLAALRCEAQNLVPNPSFELNDTCPYTIGFQEGDKPLHWDRWDQDPEYFHACAGNFGSADSLVDVPWNGFTWQYAQDGEGYVGMACFQANNFRELVGAQLVQPLVVGQTYYVSYWVNLATEGSYWWTRWACNNQGILFAMQEHIWSGSTGSGPEFMPRNFAHVNNPTIVTDTAGWTHLSGSFVADSAYQYIVLGNFFDNAHTDTVHLSTEPSWGAYYLYDAICVSTDPEECPLNTLVEEVGQGPIGIRVVDGGQGLLVTGAGIDSHGWVCDTGGRVVARFGSISGSAGDIRHLTEGLYVLRVVSAKGEAWSGKFVVVR